MIFKTGFKIFLNKIFLATLVITGYSANLFSEMPDQMQNPVPQGQEVALHPFVMMSDGNTSKAVSIEEFFKVALHDAGKNNNQDEFVRILNLKQNLEQASLQSREGVSSDARVKINSIKDSIKSAYNNSFVVDVLSECFKGSGQAVKSIAKSVIKTIATGATMGVVLLIGGTIVWQLLVIPTYCKGPGPALAGWLPVSEYWGWGEDGICHSYAPSNKISAEESKLVRAAQVISKNVPNVVLPDGRLNRQIPGYCKIVDGKVAWCDKSLCKIDSSIRGC